MGAPALEETTLGEFLARLQPQARRVPLQGVLETSYRCNLNCLHCYVNLPAGDEKARARELPTGRLLRLVDEMAEAGVLQLLLTGGEVLVRPDFETLYRHCLKRGLLVTVFTNGTLVTERIADLLAAHRPFGIEISLYGATRETYERVTRVPGSYDKCVAGIRRLRARGLPLKLKTMALRANAHEIEAMRAFAEELGLPFHHDALLNARVDCGADRHHEQQLSAEAALALERRDEAAFARLAAHAREVVGPRVEAPEAPLYTCGAGITGFTVDPYGALQLCQVSRRNGYDLREGSFAEGWNVHFPKLRARRWQGQALCRTCELVGLCGNCPGAAELEHGDPEAVVASFCEIAHARAFATLGGVAGHREDATCCLGGRTPEASEGPLIRELRVARRPGP